MSGEPADDKTAPRSEVADQDTGSQPESLTPDPNDEIPVPIAMSPAEVDERAQVVETLRERERRAEEAAPPAESPPTGS